MRALTLVTALLMSATLAGCTLPEPQPAESTDPAARPGFPLQFGGTLTKGEGDIFASAAHNFTAPEGLTAIKARLSWEGDATVAVTLRDAASTLRAEQGSYEKAGRASLVTTQPIVPGTWIARVQSGSGGAIPFLLTVEGVAGPPQRESIDATVRLSPGRLAEANIVLEAGTTIAWRFQATEPIRWDIHYHDAETGSTVTPESGDADVAEGTFTSTVDGLHSFAFQAVEAPATVQYNVEGTFRTHSYAQT